jgi:hypothetical protein
MPRDQAAVTCPPGVWTELTNSNATTATFMVLSGSVQVRATVGAVAPGDAAAGYVYHARPADPQDTAGEVRIALADLSSAAGPNRLYARPINGRKAVVIVDHA